MWLRAQWFPKAGETHWRESVDREVLQTRNSVGICDVTTLGKIDVQGADAAIFFKQKFTATRLQKSLWARCVMGLCYAKTVSRWTTVRRRVWPKTISW